MLDLELVSSTSISRRAVFRTIAAKSYHSWPSYDTSQLYDCSSLDALEEDIRTVATVWFAHEDHNSVDDFIAEFPLRYVDFDTHDRYRGSTTYQIEPRWYVSFLLKEVYGWEHETALIEYLSRTHRFGSGLVLRLYRTSRHSGERGIDAFRPIYRRLLPRALEPSLDRQIGEVSKFHGHYHIPHVITTGTTRTTLTIKRFLLVLTNSLIRLDELSIPRSRSTVTHAVKFTQMRSGTSDISRASREFGSE